MLSASFTKLVQRTSTRETNVQYIQSKSRNSEKMPDQATCPHNSVYDKFTTCGWIWAICCFPIGLLCCFMTKERVCDQCGKVLNKNQDAKKVEAPVEYTFAQKPETKEGCEAFCQFIWNSKTSEFMGRTGLSWLKIITFYIIYYAFLAGFFSLMLLIFFQTLHEDRPKWTTDNGIIGSNPGVGYRPTPPFDSNLIWFRRGDDEMTWQELVNRYESETLSAYYNDSGRYKDRDGIYKEKVDCDDYGRYGEMGRHYEQKLCRINRNMLFQGDCTPENHYGFREGKPCILLKLNKIYDWIPEVFNHYEGGLPPNFPQVLRDSYYANINDNKPEKNDKVWIECHGRDAADIENIGPIVYYPDMGFSRHFYPYRNQMAYLSPVVFMQMTRPKIGVMISVECKAWARNIFHNSMERRGLVQFEVMID